MSFGGEHLFGCTIKIPGAGLRPVDDVVRINTPHRRRKWMYLTNQPMFLVIRTAGWWNQRHQSLHRLWPCCDLMPGTSPAPQSLLAASVLAGLPGLGY